MSVCLVCKKSIEVESVSSLTIEGNICSDCKREMGGEREAWERQQKRRQVEADACRSIPTPALEAGVVEKMVEWFSHQCFLAQGFSCCDECEYTPETENENDCEINKIIKLLEEKK